MKTITSILKSTILRYIISAYIKWLLILGVIFACIFAVLSSVGVYDTIANVLDLKYNSPLVIGPMIAFFLLFVSCLIIGFILYFKKHKRGKRKTTFYRNISPVLIDKTVKKRHK
jgi:hypothetical protein